MQEQTSNSSSRKAFTEPQTSSSFFNGETDATELIPYEPNLNIIQRENKCFDLGTIGEVLMKDGLWKNYKRFITLNASIRGPFFPVYASGSCWTDVFLDRVNEKVKVRRFPAGKGVR